MIIARATVAIVFGTLAVYLIVRGNREGWGWLLFLAILAAP